MTASIFLAAAPNLIVSNKALRSGQPRYADSKFITKCRGNHEIKMKCNQTHETKMEKYDSDITRELRRRDVLGFGCLVGSGLLMLTEETNAARAEDGSCELVFDPSGLGYCDTLIGTGIEASQGQLIKAHYTGKLENGNVFDSSYGRGKPLIFRVGVGEVIKGWDRGIVGGDGIPPMLSGGKRTLKIPPELGYGVRGAGCRGGGSIMKIYETWSTNVAEGWSILRGSRSFLPVVAGNPIKGLELPSRRSWRMSEGCSLQQVGACVLA